MLEVRDLRAGYGEVEVLHGIDLSVGEREIVAVLGSNGAGKTTLNNNISGLYRPFGGTIHYRDRRIDGAHSEEIVADGLIQVPEGRKIFPNMSVRENLEMGGYRRARDRRAANMERVVDIFPRLRERAKQLAGTLSGGEQQMLAIARALMAEPELLILDEPSLGLSPILVEEIFTLIGQLHETGLAILLVEQNVVQSLTIANRAYVIENGHIALSGPAAELRDDPQLRSSYLGL
jgi:branched-chain amino acid transport system ATP-binding protein